MKILVVGGAGFVGSHMCAMLTEAGHEPVVLDNLSTGHADAVPDGVLVRGEIGQGPVLDAVFRAYRISAVIHFAAYSQVGESIADPQKYYLNNVAGTLRLVETMLRHDVRRLVFSSTAAVYGAPQGVPISEAHPPAPINPYGRSKWMVEQILNDYDQAYGLRSVSLRYFNAAGASPDGTLGERHEPETHLIPIALQVASGLRPHLEVFGRDYETPDGTCIRDYVHVEDLCRAHLLSLDRLFDGGHTATYNLGNGTGFSVLEVVGAVERVTGRRVPIRYRPRRAGDPPRLVADAALARRELGWTPRHTRLETMVAHAWQWARRSDGGCPVWLPQAAA